MSKIVIDMEERFPFYVCGDVRHVGCGRLITVLEEIERVPTGEICPCGRYRYSPMRGKLRWFHYLLPRVWKMHLALWRGQFEFVGSAAQP